jgi:hypothetical protein
MTARGALPGAHVALLFAILREVFARTDGSEHALIEAAADAIARTEFVLVSERRIVEFIARYDQTLQNNAPFSPEMELFVARLAADLSVTAPDL